MDERTTIVALAALLHDLGKFWQRAGRPGSHSEASAAFVDEFQHLFPYAWLDDIRDGAGNHHRTPRKDVEKIVKVADWLASAERETDPGLERSDPKETPLVPVASRVAFRFERPRGDRRFRLSALSLEREVMFPDEGVLVSQAIYETLWRQFTEELKKLSTLDSPLKLTSFLSLLRKYASFIPSATPWEEDEEFRTLPDISLFDHLKVTAAIATCLTRLLPDQLDALLRRDKAVQAQPVCRMIRGDLSGIQQFIYRVTRPGAAAKGTARRLRGRSFYLTLLADVIADWFVRELGLTAANILFCSGGRFDLLVPVDSTTGEKLNELDLTLQKWLFKKFYSEVGLQVAVTPVTPGDFGDFQQVYVALDDLLSEKKQRKYDRLLSHQDIFTPQEGLYHVCSVCLLTPMSEVGICQECEGHARIGQKLPRTDYLAYFYGQEYVGIPEKALVIDFVEPFKVVLLLLDIDEAGQLLNASRADQRQVTLYCLNSTEHFIVDEAPVNVAFGFRFLANSVPLAQGNFPAVKPGKEPVKAGEVLDFEEIASLSAGAQLLGILKADVDYLGSLFGLGVEPRSISRLSTLSNALDLFFAGWLNRVCQEVSGRWKSALSKEDQRAGFVDEVFYIVYSGGDDLLIIGPWDQTIELAQQLHRDFSRYTCVNENITLSAGILLVKPHFPIQRLAYLVAQELDKSKGDADKGGEGEIREKNRVTVWGETVKWTDGSQGFDALIGFGKVLAAQVEDKTHPLPKSFVYFLKQLHDQHFTPEGQCQPLWIPKFRYAVARRVEKEVMADTQLNLLFNVPAMMQRITIPVSYVSLKTRKE